jgi:hypothetical protein
MQQLFCIAQNRQAALPPGKADGSWRNIKGLAH